MNKNYKEFHITTDPFTPEIVTGMLWELDITGLSEENNVIKVFSESNSLSRDKLYAILERLVNEKLIINYVVEEFELENKNWNEEWEKSINVIEVTDKIVIKSSFRNYEEKPGQLIITIDPKMSFGTGEHQTTKLMLKLIEEYLKPGMKVLDVGSGTAVLSIAAVKLGAAKAVAIDNDELCFENGNENCRLNNVADKIQLRIGEIKEVEENGFDLILANIQKNILINIPGDIKSRLKNDGLVILSGLLEDDETDIKKHFNKTGLSFLKKEKMDEWIAVVFKLGN